MWIIFNLFIEPVVFIINIIFSSLNKILNDPGSSIVFLSIIVNFMVLPLYKRAEEAQTIENYKKKKMHPVIKHIKHAFSGDERYMMLQAYYRLEGYHPYNMFIESIPLLLQIPIFISAYKVLSSSVLLHNNAFFILHDLGRPDEILSISGLSINIMPIIMTIFNLLSAFFYSKNQTVWQKIQMVMIAIIFFVLLYNSPSGLVLYWTISQVFSLLKNIHAKYHFFSRRRPGLIISFIIIYFVILAIIFGELFSPARIIVASVLTFLSIVKIILELLHSKKNSIRPNIIIRLHQIYKNIGLIETQFIDVILVEIILACFLGLCIPTAVVSSAASEFVDLSTGNLTVNLISYPFTLYIGLFVVWGTVLFLFCKKSARCIYYGIICSLLAIHLINYFIFEIQTGFLYKDFSFDGEIIFSKELSLINVVSCFLIIFIIFWLINKKKNILKKASIVILVALLFLCGFQCFNIKNTLNNQDVSVNLVESDDILTFSKTGKNVVVLMLDRAIGLYVPYIFEEKPELNQAFDGFVYYPNTVSFGKYTNWGAPALYGGYEYTPSEINKRDTELMVDKYNESLKVLPRLYSEEKYNVTVTDPPWAGFVYPADLSIYEDLPGVKTYNLQGVYSERYNRYYADDIRKRQLNNASMYSLYRCVPLFVRDFIYDDGCYLSATSDASFYTSDFIDAYSALDELSYITTSSDDSTNCFFLLQNATPHNPIVLKAPNYSLDDDLSNVEIPWDTRTIDDRSIKINNNSDWAHYCVNMVSYLEVAKWLDKLKEEGVYDNTRIIIVADHGYYLGQFDDLIHPDGLDIESVNPTLMVKDFNSTGDMKTSNEFMTNADVATIATRGIIDKPVNPYTGNFINDDMKKNGDILISDADTPHPISLRDRTTYITEGSHWWTVQDNIFDMNNWRIVKEGEE